MYAYKGENKIGLGRRSRYDMRASLQFQSYA